MKTAVGSDDGDDFHIDYAKIAREEFITSLTDAANKIGGAGAQRIINTLGKVVNVASSSWPIIPGDFPTHPVYPTNPVQPTIYPTPNTSPPYIWPTTTTPNITITTPGVTVTKEQDETAQEALDESVEIVGELSAELDRVKRELAKARIVIDLLQDTIAQLTEALLDS